MGKLVCPWGKLLQGKMYKGKKMTVDELRINLSFCVNIKEETEQQRKEDLFMRLGRQKALRKGSEENCLGERKLV